MIFARDWENYEKICKILNLSFQEVNDLVKSGVLDIKVREDGLMYINPESIEKYKERKKQQD